MKKSYLNGMIFLVVVFTLTSLFGTINHFTKFYSPNNSSSNNGGTTPTPVPDPDPNPEPDPEPDPDPDPDPNPDPNPSGSNSEIYGYKCTTSNCQINEAIDITSDTYKLINDGENKVVIQNVKENKTEYTLTKITKAGNLYITLNQSNQYGLLKIADSIKEIAKQEFDVIEYNQKSNSYLLTKGSISYIIDENGSKRSTDYSAQIIDYNETYIITKSKTNEYHIFNFNNKEYLTEYINSGRTYIELVGSYVGVLDSNGKYVIYDFRYGNKVIGEYTSSTPSTSIRSRIVDNKIEIYENDNILKTIDL